MNNYGLVRMLFIVCLSKRILRNKSLSGKCFGWILLTRPMGNDVEMHIFNI